MSDARFEDGAEVPLNLRAEAADDLAVISALVQDAVLTGGDVQWNGARRQMVFLLNRFRWEDRAIAEREKRAYERVRSLLVISDVVKVASSGIDRADKDIVLSVLELAWTAGEDGTGYLVLTFAGHGEIRVDVECLSIDLRDVTRPYRAISGAAPDHSTR